ncbi:MAG: hypothetical protein U0457_10915 [Candidatus Sericytochromatia bacterium]
MKKIISSILMTSILSYSLTSCTNQTENLNLTELNNVEIASFSSNDKEDIDKVFNYIDTDKNSKISITELSKVFSILTSDNNAYKEKFKLVEKAFQNTDLDKSQTLDKKEFASFSTELDKLSGKIAKNSLESKPNKVDPQYVKKTFDMIRGSEDYINEKAFVKFLTNPPDVTAGDAVKVFVQLDKNKDRQLDLKEFSKLFDKMGDTVDKNGILDGVKKAFTMAGLMLLMPLAWLAEKLDIFHNIK